MQKKPLFLSVWMVLYRKIFIFSVRDYVVCAFIVEISSVDNLFGIFILRFGYAIREILRCLHDFVRKYMRLRQICRRPLWGNKCGYKLNNRTNNLLFAPCCAIAQKIRRIKNWRRKSEGLFIFCPCFCIYIFDMPFWAVYCPFFARKTFFEYLFDEFYFVCFVALDKKAPFCLCAIEKYDYFHRKSIF